MSEADQVRGDLDLLHALVVKLRQRSHPGDGVILTATIRVIEERRAELERLLRQAD